MRKKHSEARTEKARSPARLRDLILVLPSAASNWSDLDCAGVKADLGLVLKVILNAT